MAESLETDFGIGLVIALDKIRIKFELQGILQPVLMCQNVGKNSFHLIQLYSYRLYSHFEINARRILSAPLWKMLSYNF